MTVIILSDWYSHLFNGFHLPNVFPLPYFLKGFLSEPLTMNFALNYRVFWKPVILAGNACVVRSLET